MQANLVNMLAIFIGCSLGRLAGRFMDKKLEDFLMTAMGLAVLYLGIDMALKTQTDLVVILSLVLGGILGTKLNLEDRLYARGNKLQAKLAKEGGPNFATGFIGASLLFCIGSMSIVGSLQAGLEKNYATLYAKAILDGTISVVLVNTLGPGVYGSMLTVGLYQGAIVVFSKFIDPLLTPAALADLTGLGGLLIMAIGINLLGLKKIKVGDMLPGLLVLLVYHIFILA